MNRLIIILEFIVSFIINIPVLFRQWIVDWSTHKFMTQAYKKECPNGTSLGSYINFKKDFNKIDWVIDEKHPKSLFTYDPLYHFQVHASLFIIDGRAYLLTPLGLILANMLKRKKINQLKKSGNKIRWAS